jgi:hypothetical protein
MYLMGVVAKKKVLNDDDPLFWLSPRFGLNRNICEP